MEKIDFEILEPNPYQISKIIEDTIISKPFIYDNHAYWVGHTSFWQWDLSKNSLNRVKVSQNNTDLAACLIINDSEAYLATDNTLFQINNGQQKTIIKASQSNGVTRGMLFEKKWVYWIHDSGIWKYDKTSATITKLSPPNLQPSDKILKISDRSMLFTRGQYLISYQFAQAKVTVVQKGFNSFITGESLPEYTLLSSSGGVTQLSTAGDLIKIIPMNDERKLISSTFSAAQHSYLLSDGTLEIYNNKSKRSGYITTSMQSSKLAEARLSQRDNIIISSGKSWLKAFIYSKSPSEGGDGIL